jgi:(2R)-sulfolactate sulfo-lyase subunit alpha
MAAPHFIVHDAVDTVGVVVVEDVKAGDDLEGWVMETDERIKVAAKAPIPLGHKVALADIAEGDTIIKYGHDIGRAVAGIEKGGHAHVQNVKTKKW